MLVGCKLNGNHNSLDSTCVLAANLKHNKQTQVPTEDSK